MSKPEAPSAPNPTATIAAQQGANSASALQTAELNRINQNTPYGSLSYSTDGTYADGTPVYTQNQTLSPSQQNLFNLGQQGAQTLGQTGVNMLGQVQNSYANPIDYSGSPGISSGVSGVGSAQMVDQNSIPQLSNQINSQGQINGGVNNQGPGLQGQLDMSGVPGLQGSLNLNGLPGMQSSVYNSGPGITGRVANGANSPWAIQQAENSAYNQQTQYLDPQFSQKHEALDNSLINQGVTQGSDAYKAAQQNLGLQENQAYGNAGLQAVQAGQNEQNTLFGQGLSASQLQNSANAQGYSQGLSSAQLANSVNSQGYNQALGAGQFQNSANAQGYNQALGSGQFQNSANAQGFSQGLSAADLANSAQAQSYGQGLTQTNLNNTNAQQNLSNIFALNSANNATQQQQFGQGLSSANLQNSAQAQYLQQLFAQRNQPLNEYNALATGSQVTQPNFQQFAQSPVASTNVAGITNDAYQNQLSAYQQQMAGINNLFSLGGSLGSAAILA